MFPALWESAPCSLAVLLGQKAFVAARRRRRLQHVRAHLLLPRRPHLRQPGAPGVGRQLVVASTRQARLSASWPRP